MSAESHDLLERLLREASGSATTSALHEAAADGGHPDEAQLEELLAGTVEAERARALRRHVLFCDSCTARMANKTATSAKPAQAVEDSAQSTASSAVPAVPPAVRRRLLIILSACGITLALLAGYFILSATDEQGEGGEEPFMLIDSMLDVGSIGSGGEESRGFVRAGLPVFIEIVDRLGPAERYVYVLVVDGRGKAHVLAPREGPARALRIDGVLRLPDAGGWRLEEVTPVSAGDELAFLLVAGEERIGVLEGEIATLATMPRLSEDLREIWPPADETALEELVRRFRAFGFGGVVRGVRARVQP